MNNYQQQWKQRSEKIVEKNQSELHVFNNFFNGTLEVERDKEIG